MADRDQQREDRRNEKEISSSPEKFRFEAPADRPTDSCSVPEEVVPDVFIKPTPCPTPADPARLIPGALDIGNDELTLNCEDVEGLGPIGDSVTLEKGAVTLQVYFTEIPDITSEQLDRIAKLSEEQLALLADESTSIASIVQLTGMKESQATFFQERVSAVTLEVQELALTTAAALLACIWRNEEQTASCPVDALESPNYPEEGVVNPVVIAAGSVDSSESQEDADALALEQAELELSCVWGNEEITVDCEQIGFTEAVPNDTELQGSAGRLRVGSFTIAANTVFSPDSQSEANEQARAQAELSLACFYINEEKVVDCDSQGFPGTVDFPVDASDNVGGSPVTVPLGLLESPLSTADANEQAEALALSLLDCFWYNVEKTADCPTLTLEDDTPLPPHESSPTISAVVAAGEVISRVSQDAADEEAQTRANLLLRCIYCNLQIDPECLPPDVVDPPIPIPVEDIESHWSIDATLGVAEGTFCGDDETVQPLAETVNFPAKPTTGACAYQNDEIIAGCIEDETEGIVGLYDAVEGADLSSQSRPNPHAADPVERTLTVAAGLVTILDVNVPGTFLPTDPQRYKKWANMEAERLALTLLNCFFGNDEYEATCPKDVDGVEVHPTATASAIVPEDFFQSYVSKAEADAQAVSYGESLLDCFWMNDEITATCPDVNPSDDAQYHPSAITEVTVAADTYPSRISKENANFFAREIAESSLNCLYTNLEQLPDECPEGTDDYGSAPVPADTTVSVISGEDADLQALSLANASRTCLDPEEVGVPGPAGADGTDGSDGEDGQDGAQTNCDGECLAIFA